MIFRKISSALYKLSFIGADSSLPYMQRNRIQGVNIAAIAMLITLGFVTTLNFIFEQPDRFVNLGVLFYLLTLLMMNKLKLHLCARISATFIFPLIVLYLSMLYGGEARLDNLFVILIISPFLLYDSLLMKIGNLGFIFALQVIDVLLTKGSDATFGNLNNQFNIIVIIFGSAVFVGVLFNFLFSEFYRFNSEQFRLRKAVESKNESLEREVAINKERNELFATLAHDLKGPASFIAKFSKQVDFLVESNDIENLKKLSSHNYLAGENISYTVNNLLDWALSQMGEIGHDPSYFDLRDCIAQVLEQLKYITQEKNIRIVNNQTDSVIVFFNYSDLQVILRNIIHNSHKYSPDGSSIVITCKTDKTCLSLSIMDYGDGLNSDDLKIIRSGETFGIHDAQNKNRGYGIGLATCHRLLKKNNADWLINSSSDGTTFTLQIAMPIAAFER